MRSSVGLAVAAGVLTACGQPASESSYDEPSAPGTSAVPTPSASATEPVPSPSTTPSATDEPPGPAVSDGRPLASRLTISKLDIRGLDIVPYRGHTDDATGTAIQNRGRAASPYGPRGGVGPGGVGNFQVTAHRLSSTRAFEFLPDLVRGDEVTVEAGGRRYVYRVTGTRETSFRSADSLRAQRAAVPGRPGVEPTRAMITLSTCATLEDHAEGNYWSDEFDNPEHRIDKIGVLVRSSPA